MVSASELDMRRRLDSLARELSQQQVWYRRNYSIKFETYFKTGGIVNVYVCPASLEELVEVVRWLADMAIPYKLIGQTTNLVLLDGVEYGVLVSTKNIATLRLDDGFISVECGYLVQDLVRVAAMQGATGFEGLEGVPGTVGGGIFMNAGAYGYQIADALVSVDWLDCAGLRHTLSREECQFTYRDSRFRRDRGVVLGARFRLKEGPRKEIEKRIETFHIARHSYQEFVYPNAGSLFSSPSDFYEQILSATLSQKLALRSVKVLWRNPLTKFIVRKRPTNAPLNWLARAFGVRTEARASHKSMNILINDGLASFPDVVEYAITLKRRLPPNVRLENEFVTVPVLSVDPRFVRVYERICAELTLPHE